ncbi:MAG: protein kinase [Bryobacteraceae bacterium]
MTPEQRIQIRQLLEEALELDDGERHAFLQAACHGDPTLRIALDELLEGRGPMPEFLRDAEGVALGPVFSSGTLIDGRFRIERFRGRGGMGEVYEAFDSSLGVRLGLKTLRGDINADQDAIDRFRREVLVARTVTHPNLCRVYDMVEHRSTNEPPVACLTMEWLEGETLAAYLERSRPLSPAVALPLIRQIAAALEALHAAGLVHRDLKPGNVVMVAQPGGGTRAVVTDFGLAKPAAAGEEFFESVVDAQAGAPYFMAPEQLKNERPTTASDVYSFGLMIDEMVTVERAFSAPSLAALYYQRLFEQPALPRDRAPDLPDHWDRTIRRCLATDPAARPATAAAVLAELDGQLPSLPEPAKVPPARPPAGPRYPVFVLAGLAILALVVAVGFALNRAPASIEVFEIDGSSATPEMQYLGHGATAEVLRRLSEMKQLRVIPVHATRRDAPSTAGGAAYALSGELIGGPNARLSISLTGRGHVVWSATFDEQLLENRTEFQNRIAQQVAAAIDQQIGRGLFAGLIPRWVRWPSLSLNAQLPRPPTADSEALDLYMRGSKLFEEFSPASALAAATYYERALERDPNFALAMAAGADAYLFLKNQDAARAGHYLQRAGELAARAVQADPNLAEGHASLAAVKQAEWDWPAAEESYREALRLKPRYSRAHRRYAGLILQFGRFDDALSHARQALELDPYDRSGPGSLGGYLFVARRYREALEILEPAVRDRETAMTRHNLAQVYAQLGVESGGVEADAYFAKALEQARILAGIEERERTANGPAAKLPSLSDQIYALAHSLAGDTSAAEPYLKRLEADLDARRIPALTVAWVYAAQGRSADAISVLERAVAYRDPALLYIKVIPFLDKLHAQPRFQALVAQMRL